MRILMVVYLLLLALVIFVDVSKAHGVHLSGQGDLTHHLSGQGDLTHISTSPCDGGYAVNTEELGCTFMYKGGETLTHSGIHIKFLLLDKDGDCTCPEERDD
jgi:hypothetical protein